MNTSNLTKALVLTSAMTFTFTPATFAATNLYPDLKTLPPDDLTFATEPFGSSTHQVLRFSNTVWNAGQGPLEIYGSQATADRTEVTQRIYDDEGNATDAVVGYVVFHDAHNHWHFENFAEYQLWTKLEYDQWVASGRNPQELQFQGYKTTFCIRETMFVEQLPGAPASPTNTECGQEKQGLAVGWGDTYEYTLPEQWIDLGESSLPDGDYVIRSIADPLNLLKESEANDPTRESDVANEAVTIFSVQGGTILPFDGTPDPEPVPSEIPTEVSPFVQPTPVPTDPSYPDRSYNSPNDGAYQARLERLRERIRLLLLNLTR